MTDNIYQFSDRETVEKETREWLIRLDGNIPLSSSELNELHEWISRSPVHRHELERLFRFWKNANILTELAIPLEQPSTVKKILNLLPLPRSNGSRAVWISAVSVLLLAVSISLWLPKTDDKISNGIYVTEIDQQKKHELIDGSSFQLNTDSKAQVDYGDAARKIYLLRGEAHFDVVHNPDKPFEVYAGNNIIRAVGTAFSVYLQDKKVVNVTVTEGKVILGVVRNENTTVQYLHEHPDTPVLATLKAGERATVNESISEITELAVDELNKKLSWREGVLIFNGDALAEVVSTLNRYTPVMIEITEPELRTLKIGGRFKTGDIEAVLEVLETNFDIKVTRLDNDQIHLASKK